MRQRAVAARWDRLPTPEGRAAATLLARTAMLRSLDDLLDLTPDLAPEVADRCRRAVRRANMTILARHREHVKRRLAELEAAWAIRDQDLAQREAAIEAREAAVAGAEKALVARLAGAAA